MRTFESYLQEAQGFQGKFKPDPDTKRQAIQLNNKVTQQRKPGGALATRPSSALATRPADKGASIVRQKGQNKSSSNTGNLNFKKDRTPSKGYMSEPDTKTGPYSRPKNVVRNPKKMGPYEKEMEKIRARKDSEKTSMGSKVSSALKGTAKAGLGLAKKAVDSTKGTSVETSSSGSLGGPTLSQGGRTSK